MAVRRVRYVIAAVALWVIGSWYYGLRPPSATEVFDPPVDLEIPKYGDDRWHKLPTRYPVEKLAQLPINKSSRPIPRVQAPRPQEDAAAKEERLARLAAVKESFIHSWEGYKTYAWGHDEIKPITGESKDPFGGWAATLVDSLDSLWLMGMKDEFDLAVKACDGIDFAKTMARDINVFETTIRYLGGFLAAYELSEKQYPVLLSKSIEVADVLMSAFDTPNRMPVTRFPWRNYVEGKAQKAGSTVLVAEVGSLSLEFTKLSQLTGDMQYYDAIQRIYDDLERGQGMSLLPGMWPVVVDASKTPMAYKGDSFSLGGMSDSVYEYLGKQYLLLGGASEQPREMYEGFIAVAKEHLLRRALNPDNLPLLFFGDVRVAKPPAEGPSIITSPRAQHLTCFTGGMVGMAAKIFDRPSDLAVAAQLTDGCVWSYSRTVTGIGPEIFHFVPCDPDARKDDCLWSETRWIEALRLHWGTTNSKGVRLTDDQIRNIIESRRLPPGMVDVNDRRYILRPEAIESVFMMYRLTGDSKWMDKAWGMFTAIEKYTRTRHASAALEDITKKQPIQVDSMESFWLAETLKYFYLIFGDWDLVDLDQWVLNTEAHPLRRADA
ncbi:Uu.00g091390.m01.CDS01 [Anthostomella pinea]|uniref:alpha-1,2-Mannosidase n=1 Tax=Anthostomella pinea TaxID=933095 RepID=A0AAI8YKH7_9PEZI|nr:Uu.00g091390.m01.CDS01 [Anthostomella pinea]